MPNEPLSRVRRAALRALQPPPRLALSAWIETEIRLPADVSALPGPIRLYPFQRGIADAISDPEIERVTVVKSARIGYTTLLVGALASHVVNEPAPVLFVLPTEDDCRNFVVTNVEPTFEASPVLAGALTGEAGGENRNTLLSRRFPGGSLKVVASKSPRNLRAHNTRVLIVDEADAMEMTAEGSPILLAEKRTLSFPDRKIVIGSTPIFEETSHVLNAYGRSDMRVFEVPCPGCGAFQEITWRDIHWPEGRPQDAHWACPACGSVVEERHKPAMVAGGRWRATAPEVEGHAGFRVNALVSPLANASWGKLAAEFLTAKDTPELLQTFVNTVLGQGWRAEGEELDEAALAARAEGFSVEALPEDVLAVTAGVDVQRDRLEITFVGWSRTGDAFALGHSVVWGLPADGATWAELDSLLKTRLPHPLGGTLGLDAVAIDSGDGETMEAVYAFAFPRAARKVLAIKGASGARPWIERSKSRIKGGRLWIVGVDGIKSHLAGRLSSGTSVRFSRELPAVWFEQLASERAVVRYARGQPQRRFERIAGRRAEALDCMVYAFAARQLINPNWDERRDALARPEVRDAKPAGVIRSGWCG
ncbi:phage terminase large subunit family protein [Stappia taiwanensis]|uniref:Phage terminase large subunit family protein n=1 Tax=Stappia taiwanensis TaxID=992267 RepID=A0A838XH89_9HYPH|nr:phage terminase large subunit family protein [Stappia taiwanensis]MBA4610759.1 phage terminase large subunit family protein [Stappia taiwanensis]GGE96139.1 terminase [Stappia taiwanensis]